VVLLALAIPISKIVQERPPKGDLHENTPTTFTSTSEKRDGAVIRALVAAEETYLNLSPKMNILSRGLLDLRLPGPTADAESVFSTTVTTVDLDLIPAAIPTGPSTFESHPWPVAALSKQTDRVDLWRPIFDEISFFEHAKVEIISGVHPDGNMLRYEAKGGFEALARMKSDQWRSFEGRMELTWEYPRTDDGAAGDWQITGWKTTEMHWRASPKRLFVESLDTAMHESQEASMLRRSLHYEATVKHYRDGTKQLPHPYFAPISANQTEGIAVADVNGDGFDDIYITMRLGKNMLLPSRMVI
jgi:hypothetical protein